MKKQYRVFLFPADTGYKAITDRADSSNNGNETSYQDLYSPQRGYYGSKNELLKNIFCLLLFIFMGLCNVSPLLAQWMQLNGPYGGEVSFVAFTPNGSTIYAGTANGVFRSADHGKTWTQTGLTTGGIGQIIFAPDGSVFAKTNIGVLRSSDNGASWDSVDTGLPIKEINSLAFSSDSSIIFAATNGGGVFRSMDNGASWTQDNNVLTNHSVYALAVLDTTMFAGTDNGVFRSTDNGDNWTLTGFSGERVGIAVSPKDSAIFALTDFHGIFKSTDMGGDWCKFGLADTSVSGFVISPDGSTLFAGSPEGLGVFRSPTNEDNWTQVNTGLTDTWVYSLAISPDGSTIFDCTPHGIFYSDNNGGSWTMSNTGITNASAHLLTLSPDESEIYAGTDEGLFVSKNNGSGWMGINNGLPNKLQPTNSSNVTSLVFSKKNGTTDLYAGTADGVFKSTDNGADWSLLGTSLLDNSVSSLVVTPDGSTIYAGTYDGVIRYSAGSWTQISKGLPIAFSVTDLGISPDGSTIYAAGIMQQLKVTGQANTGGTTDHIAIQLPNNAGIYSLSTDSASWTRVDSVDYVTSIVVSPDGSIFAGTSYDGVLRYTNNGTGWTRTNEGLTGGPVPGDTTVSTLAISPDGSVIFAGTDYGIFMSTDEGAKWTQVNTGLPHGNLSFTNNGTYFIDALAVSGTTVFAGINNNGLWERPLSELTPVEKYSTNLPTRFSLGQNYPNPFNPGTTIRFKISTPGLVSLKIYDTLGREVASLVNRQMSPGSYYVRWNAAGFASGVYFYRLRAGNVVQVRKMLLLK